MTDPDSPRIRTHRLRGLWAWLGKPKPTLGTLADLLGIVGFCATIGLFPFIWHLANRSDKFVELYCPDSIRTHQYSIFGRFAGEGYQVRVYVGPEDGTYMYWLQTPPLHFATKGQWSLRARFGNPYGWDHVKEPPLEYEVLAALVPAKKLGVIPGADGQRITLAPGQDLEDLLTPLGITSVQRCTIRRDPEYCQYLPRMVQPKQPINPQDLPDLVSPVRVAWEPNLPMFIELWRGGERVRGLSHEEWSNNREVKLGPGIYELHVRYKRESDCDASSWFRVVLPSSAINEETKESPNPAAPADQKAPLPGR
jgi:hypothetical protein